MTIAVPPEEKADRLNRLLTVTLLRVAGVCLFMLGVETWIRLVGIYDGPLNRFDLMPLWWKIAAPALAVLYPVAGVGLWMAVSWGAVTWAIVAAVEIIMHVVFPELFGGVTLLVILHISGLSLLLVLRLIDWWVTRQRLHRRG